jgi:hypothetical protein
MVIVLLMLNCDDEINPSAFARRTVYYISEENLTGNGGYVQISELDGINDINGEQEMPVINVYGDKRTDTNWEELFPNTYRLESGRIFIDATGGNSNYYRIVVIK